MAKRNKTANEVALASWIESKTEEEIRAANRARSRLRKLGFNSKFRLIDPRHVPKIQPYTVFFKERWSSGAFSNQVVTEAAKQIGREWKALSDAEREVCFPPVFSPFKSAFSNPFAELQSPHRCGLKPQAAQTLLSVQQLVLVIPYLLLVQRPQAA